MPERVTLTAPPRAIRATIALAIACTTLVALGGVARPARIASAAAAETSGSAESSASGEATLPEQMARVGGAQQLVIATGNKLGATTGTLRFFDYEGGAWVCTLTAPCRFGKHGLMDGIHRWSGNKTTPTGLWQMPGYVFGYRTKPAVATKMRYVRITKRSWWSSHKGSSYNAWIEAKRWQGEHLYGVVPQYELAVSTGYNARPNQSVYGRGSGIFLHINGNGFTAGCVSLKRADMLRVAGLLDPAKRPAFAVGTLQRGAPTSIWAY